MYTTTRVIHPLVTDIEVKAELTLLVEALELPASASAPITPATSKTVVAQHPSVTSPFRLSYVHMRVPSCTTFPLLPKPTLSP